jgi:hypothetical protein
VWTHHPGLDQPFFSHSKTSRTSRTEINIYRADGTSRNLHIPLNPDDRR